MSAAIRLNGGAGLRAAIGLYLARPSWRGNYCALLAGVMLAASAVQVPHALHAVRAHGIVALYGRDLLGIWWMAVFYAGAALSVTYWGRVGGNLAPMLPTLLAAEHRAAAVVLIVAELLLAAPLMALGAPPGNALALTTLASLGGFGFGRAQAGGGNTGQGRAHQVLTGLVFLPLLFVGGLDSVVRAVGTAPGWIAWPGTSVVLALAIGALRYRPAWAARQDAAASGRLDTGPTATAGPGPRGIRPAPRLPGLLAWRPAPLREQPLPPGPFNPGTLGLALQVLAMMAAAALVGRLMQAASPGSSGAGHRQAGALLGSAASLLVLASSSWLLSRGDWTRIFVAGRHGSRRGFSRTLITAHLLRTAHGAVVTGLVLGAVMLALRIAPAAAALRQAIAVALMVFAASQFGCLGALASRLSKLWTGAGNFGGMLAVNLAASTLLSSRMPGAGQWWPVALLAGFAAICGLAVAAFGVAGLDRADWTPDDGQN